jgi:hypothetical protein
MSAFQMQELNNFTWVTATAASGGNSSKFIDVSISPKRNLFGLMSLTKNTTSYQYLYEYNFTTGSWVIHDEDFQAQSIKFDNLGNKYYLDTQGNVYGPNQNTKSILSGDISDFAINSEG